MEINITQFYTGADPSKYAASCAERGQNAALLTWSQACDDAPDYNFLDTPKKRNEFRAHIRGFGLWDDREIEAFTDHELTALLVQMISADIREKDEIDGGIDWAEYEALSRDGVMSGALFKTDNGDIYYTL